MDFDASEALVMTAGGLGMAFFVLILLMVFTSVMGRLLQTRSTGDSSPLEREDAQLAAATAVAVALAERRQQRALAAGQATSVWATRGRQEIMDSRSGRGR